MRPRISPAMARQLIDEVVATTATQVELSVADYTEVVARLGSLGLAVGSIYDALIARAAEKSEVDQLMTFNDRDFRRVRPEDREVVTRPWAISENEAVGDRPPKM